MTSGTAGFGTSLTGASGKVRFPLSVTAPPAVATPAPHHNASSRVAPRPRSRGKGSPSAGASPPRDEGVPPHSGPPGHRGIPAPHYTASTDGGGRTCRGPPGSPGGP